MIIDSFTRFIELFTEQEVTEIAAADALWPIHGASKARYWLRLTVFQRLTFKISRYQKSRHDTVRWYSRTGKQRCQSTNKKHFIILGSRKTLVTVVYDTTSAQQFRETTTRGLIKYTIFGNVFSSYRSLLTQIEHDVSGVNPRSTQNLVNTLIARHTLMIDVAIHSQIAINEANLRKRYANYARNPKIRQRLETEVDEHSGTTEPLPLRL